MMHQKSANLLHYYVEKQVFSWRAKISNILYTITWKSSFSHDTPKRCKFVALLRFEASFLVTHQKFLYLMHYYVEKQVFSWHAKTCTFVALLRFEAGFLMTRQKLLYLMHYYVEKQVFLWGAKKCKFVALLLRKAGFLMTRQNLIYFSGKAGFLITRQKGANLLYF